jgi:hypothetical protein
VTHSSGLDRWRIAADIIAAAAMVVAAGVLVFRTWSAAPAATATRAGPPELVSYSVGDTLGPIPGIDFGSSRLTLVAYLQSSCRFCDASMTFYRGLVDEGSKVPMVVIGFEPQSVLDDYVARHRFKPDRVVSVAIGTLRFRGTPTLALIERDGKIRSIWRGQLKPDREAEVRLSLQ